MLFYLPDLKWLSPKPWMTFRGRINRRQFWFFYAFVVTCAFLLISILSNLAQKFPEQLMPFFPYIFLLSAFTTVILLSFAMIRRLRDSAFHWIIVPLSFIAMFVAIFSYQAEATIYQLNHTQGTHIEWLEQRWNMTEISAIIALFFNLLLFWGLTRKSKP